MVGALGRVRRKPPGEQLLDLVRQAQQDVAGGGRAGRRGRFQDPLDLVVGQSPE